MPHSPHAVMGLKYVTIIVSITYFVDFSGLQSREDHGRRGRGGGEMVNVGYDAKLARHHTGKRLLVLLKSGALFNQFGESIVLSVFLLASNCCRFFWHLRSRQCPMNEVAL